MFKQQQQQNPFAQKPVEEIASGDTVCSEFTVDLETDSKDRYVARKGKEFEVTWDVESGKKVTISTSPRSTTKYFKKENRAMVVPSATGTLTLRLKVDSHFMTQSPCEPIKVRVLDRKAR